MSQSIVCLTGLVITLISFQSRLSADHPPSITPMLETYLHDRISEFDQIDGERKNELGALAKRIQVTEQAGAPVQLNFICTHNSRRSHLAQIWTAVAVHHFGISNIRTFSGGTEATAMNERIVATLKRAGLIVESDADASDPNPHYQVRFADLSLECFSKVYNEAPNPQNSFVAVLVCGNADRNCPVVSGATDRLVIRYDDPKMSDNTIEESQTYDARCEQIAREMLYAISLLASV